jgi:hypothetical protein
MPQPAPVYNRLSPINRRLRQPGYFIPGVAADVRRRSIAIFAGLRLLTSAVTVCGRFVPGMK